MVRKVKKFEWFVKYAFNLDLILNFGFVIFFLVSLALLVFNFGSRFILSLNLFLFLIYFICLVLYWVLFYVNRLVFRADFGKYVIISLIGFVLNLILFFVNFFIFILGATIMVD